MNDIAASSATFGMVISLVGYGIGVLLQRKTKSPICNPLLVSIIIVISFLTIFHVDYENYESGARYLTYLLTPATVSLAVPLYLQFERLKKNWLAIFIGVTSGCLASLASILFFAVIFGVEHDVYVTLLPKSITTAIGLGITEELGGIPAITVAGITITGILGNVIAETVCRLFRITDPVAKGLAIGTASHAAGTAKAMEIGEVEGAMSSLAIVVNGLLTVIFASFFAMLY